MVLLKQICKAWLSYNVKINVRKIFLLNILSNLASLPSLATVPSSLGRQLISRRDRRLVIYPSRWTRHLGALESTLQSLNGCGDSIGSIFVLGVVSITVKTTASARQQRAQRSTKSNLHILWASATLTQVQSALRCTLWYRGLYIPDKPRPKGHLINILSDTRLALVSPNLRCYAWKKGVTKLRCAT